MSGPSTGEQARIFLKYITLCITARSAGSAALAIDPAVFLGFRAGDEYATENNCNPEFLHSSPRCENLSEKYNDVITSTKNDFIMFAGLTGVALGIAESVIYAIMEIRKLKHDAGESICLSKAETSKLLSSLKRMLDYSFIGSAVMSVIGYFIVANIDGNNKFEQNLKNEGCDLPPELCSNKQLDKAYYDAQRSALASAAYTTLSGFAAGISRWAFEYGSECWASLFQRRSAGQGQPLLTQENAESLDTADRRSPA